MSLSVYQPGFDKDALYELKYQILSKRCVEVKKETDRIYERLLRCKRMLGKVLYERRALKDKLERQYHDNFSQIQIPEFQEEDYAYELLLTQKQACRDANKDISLPNQSPESKTGTSSKTVSQSVSYEGNTPSGNRRLIKAKASKKSATAENGVFGGSTSSVGTVTAPVKKDPGAPRKPVNAYFIFCERKRSTVQLQLVNERNGEVDRKEVTRRLGQMWGALTENEKNVYFDEYRKDKVRYGLEMEEYVNSKRSLDESGIISEQFDGNLASSSIGSVPPKRKRIRKSKLKSEPIVYNFHIPSSASSPVQTELIPEGSDNAVLLACIGPPCVAEGIIGVDDVYKNMNMNIKIENEIALENANSSSLTPLDPILDKLEPTSPPILMAVGEDATDEVFLSSNVMDSPGVINASSSGESFDHQAFMHSVAMSQLFCPSGSEMPVP